MSNAVPTYLDEYFGTGISTISWLGSQLTYAPILDFEGPGVTSVVYDSVHGRNVVTIAGGGGGGSTTLAANFTQPAVSSNVSATFSSTSLLAAGLGVFIAGGGYYQVVSVTDGTHAVIENLGYSGNATPTSTVTSGGLVLPFALPPTSGPSQVPFRVTSTQTLDGTKANIYANTTGGAFALTMPATANVTDGFSISFKDDHQNWATSSLHLIANTSQQIQNPIGFTIGSSVFLTVNGGQQGFQWDATQSIWQAF